MARAHVSGAASARASTASWRTFDGPDPNRPSEGRSSAGRAVDLGVALVTRPRLVSQPGGRSYHLPGACINRGDDLGVVLAQALDQRFGSGTAAVSVTIPMQHGSQCDTRVTLSAEPEGGANA